MASIVKKYTTEKERKSAVCSWRKQLMTECESSDSFYRDRWDELCLAYEDDIMDDDIFEEFYEDFLQLLENPGQHY